MITALEPRFDLIHRGVEKLFASRDYRQCLVLADRHDWLSSFNSELGLVMLIEDAIGIEVPEAVLWIRMAMAELARVAHGLAWIGGAAGYLGHPSALEVRAQCTSAREALIQAQAAASGGRMHPMFVEPGGLRGDVPPDWPDQVQRAAATAAAAIANADGWLAGEAAVQEFGGAARLSPDLAAAHGATGTVARASGIACDLRRSGGRLRYAAALDAGALNRACPTAPSDDALGRLALLAAETAEALGCLAFAAEGTATSPPPARARLPRTWRVPEGEYYVETEGPTGINGWLLIAQGGPGPIRLKIASASFANAQALSAAMIGQPVDDLPTMVLSSMLVAGDLGR